MPRCGNGQCIQSRRSARESVGRVRSALRKRGLEENTILIFLSDQGGYFENPPFRGGKRADTLFEGGARVPLLFHWPGLTQSGAKNRSIVHSTDLFPTLVEIAGDNPSRFEDLDGVSLAPIIRNNSILRRGDPIFGYRAYEDLYASVRDEDWKLLAYRSGLLKLYNIARDDGERADVAQEYPEVVTELRNQLASWEREMDVDEYSGIQ